MNLTMLMGAVTMISLLITSYRAGQQSVFLKVPAEEIRRSSVTTTTATTANEKKDEATIPVNQALQAKKTTATTTTTTTTTTTPATTTTTTTTTPTTPTTPATPAKKTKSCQPLPINPYNIRCAPAFIIAGVMKCGTYVQMPGLSSSTSVSFLPASTNLLTYILHLPAYPYLPTETKLEASLPNTPGPASNCTREMLIVQR